MSRWIWALALAALAGCPQAPAEVCSQMARPRHALTADTFLLWRLDETDLPDADPAAGADEAGHYPIIGYGPQLEVAPAIVDEGGHGVLFPFVWGEEDYSFQANPATTAIGLELEAILRGSFTWECYFAPGYGFTEDGPLWEGGGPVAPFRAIFRFNQIADDAEDYPRNGFMFALSLTGQAIVSYGNASDDHATDYANVATLVSPPIVDVTSIAERHLSLVKRMVGTETVFDVYVDHVLMWTSPAAANLGAIHFDDTREIVVGYSFGAARYSVFVGTLDDVRLRSSASPPPALPPRHEVTDDTVFLFRFDDPASGTSNRGRDLPDSGPNGRTLKSTFGGGLVIPGPGGQGTATRARWFRLAHHRTILDSGAESTAIIGNWTAKTWINVEDLAASGHRVWSYGQYNAGANSSENTLFTLETTTDGRLLLSWHHGSQVRVDAQTAAAVFSADAWHHLAAVKEDDGAHVGKKKVTFYVDGAAVGSVDNLTNSDGGAHAHWIFGDDEPLGGGAYVPTSVQARSIIVSSVVSSAGDIAADFARTSGPNAYTHVDGGVIVHWKGDEIPAHVDEVLNYYLNPDLSTFDVAPPLVAGGGYSRAFDGNGDEGDQVGVSPDMELLRAAMLGDFTLEVYLQPWLDGGDPFDLGNYRGLFGFGGALYNEAPVSGNDAGQFNPLQVSLTTDGRVYCRWRHGAAATIESVLSPVLINLDARSTIHVAVAKRVVGGDAIFDAYINHIYRWSSTPAPNYSGGEEIDHYLVAAMGFENDDEFAEAGFFLGTMDDPRLRSSAPAPPPLAAQYWPPPPWQQSLPLVAEGEPGGLFRVQYWPPPSWAQANTDDPGEPDPDVDTARVVEALRPRGGIGFVVD